MLHARTRRLPVFFLIDDSADMVGTMSVAASEGLQGFQRDLVAHPLTLRSVYLSVALLNEQAAASPLSAISYFIMPAFRAEGHCLLEAGLQHVRRTIEDSVIPDSSGRQGDLHPIVFTILGGPPADDAPRAADALTALDSATQPRLFTFTASDNAAQLDRLGGHLLHLTRAGGPGIAGAFAWAAEVVIAICDAQARGEASLTLPVCPSGIRLLR